MNGYQKLIVWQVAMDLALRIYVLTEHFPTTERYALSTQMRRAAVSIPSNLAEGYRRRHRQAWLQFVRIAFGSASELETQTLIAKNLKLAPEGEFTDVTELLNRVLSLLNKLEHSLNV